MFRIKNQFSIDKPNRAYIKFVTLALGDTIAYMPYVNEFQKRFGGTTYVACGWGDLFDYPNLTYIPNKSNSKNWVKYLNLPDHDDGYRGGTYVLGSMHNPLHSLDSFIENAPKGIPISLQTTGARQLGLLDLEEKEIKPKIKAIKGDRKIHEKYVCIAMHAAVGNPQKYWNNLTGWQGVVDYLIDELGYTVVCIDIKSNYNYKGKSYDIPKRVLDKTGNIDIQDRMVDLKYADFFIGNSSGLAWLSWTVDTHVFMINGFTFPQNEFQSGCTHIYNPTVCTGCYVLGNPAGICYFNGKEFTYRKDFFGRCPKYEVLDPDRMFECTASITSEIVIEHIKKHTYSIGQSTP